VKSVTRPGEFSHRFPHLKVGAARRFKIPSHLSHGSAGATVGDLLGHLVAFEYVLEGAHLEPVVIGGADHHEDFIGAVAMDVHVAIPP
jgi:hypothetical protein